MQARLVLCILGIGAWFVVIGLADGAECPAARALPIAQSAAFAAVTPVAVKRFHRKQGNW